MEEATSIIADKDETVRQLELKLRTANNQRAIAEDRCGRALEEQERMKGDMATLAQQLQDAEERVLDALRVKAGGAAPKSIAAGKQVGVAADLRATLAAKEEKLRGLRTAIVRLKEEFIKAEENHALARETKEMDKENRVVAQMTQADDQVGRRAWTWLDKSRETLRVRCRR